MTNQAYPSVNGFVQSWSDIGITLTPGTGVALTGADIKGIKHGGKVEIGKQRSGGRVKSRTTGSVDYDASITFYRSGLRDFVDTLIAAAPVYAIRGNQVLLTLIGFQIDIQHTPPGLDRIFHHVCKGARLIGYTADMKEGNDADEVEVPLDVVENAEIVNGKEIVLL